MSWFIHWFDSYYYHILYKNRDLKEAELLIKNLIRHLRFDSEIKIIDVGCGKGRHAIFLNKLGFDVTGIDLSKENIDAAKKKEKTAVEKKVKKMRESVEKSTLGDIDALSDLKNKMDE